ncbi:DUF2510 domain-containing protein [Blastococcus brunescens]|uniref:DUF2510 domain-containing protein n=1 Tax=Blastococcus brunescens TaxID=1564165 RepID=A0ABZ1AVC5_9ACTN|nr:DUF2510 domain-containing protein [Blastococcus sp. BMG 8361]WRL62414.1 DUF2510 domain-containing protein [Blastococcus sp. BMG 8361]
MRRPPGRLTPPALTPPAAQAGPPAGWYPDPHTSDQWRWWNGVEWAGDLRSG